MRFFSDVSRDGFFGGKSDLVLGVTEIPIESTVIHAANYGHNFQVESLNIQNSTATVVYL